MIETASATAYASVDIRAPIERVFDAWLDPALAARFLSAGESIVSEASIDPKVGGCFRIVMRDEKGEYAHTGHYVEIARPNRLIFTWTSTVTQDRETLVTITFHAIGQGTRVDVLHERLPTESVPPHIRGWTSILEKLEQLVSKDRP